MKTILTFLFSGWWLMMPSAQGQTQLTKAKPKPGASISKPVNVTAIGQSLTKVGGKATLQKYFCGNDMTGLTPSYAMKQVATGEKQWVDIAMKLYKYSDAGCTEALNDALGTGLQEQPRNVLPYVGNSVFAQSDEVCLPFISDEIPDADALREVRRSKAAILSVKDKTLHQQCQTCLVRITRLENKILADIAKKKSK